MVNCEYIQDTIPVILLLTFDLKLEMWIYIAKT